MSLSVYYLDDRPEGARDMRNRTSSLLALVGALVLLAGCSTAGPTSPTSAGASGASRTINIVAAENFWGSIAAQLGGSRVKVTSIINSPDADPHDYEPTAADGRAIAESDLVLINGIGYDTWASKLAAANPNPRRTDLTVGSLLGVPDGGNPHRWYNPDDVQQVIDQLVADYQRLDPADSAYFTRQQQMFETTALASYKRVVADIKSKYRGTPVGASESIFAMLAPALGLDLLTPSGFLKAISEGTDPTAADKKTIDEQIASGAIKVYVYNSQNATPDIQTQIKAARSHGIPVTTITETLTPAGASWEQWQTAQLTTLKAALARATGK
jgi:zinc/manganese transport system substrate-binding protein